MKLAKYEWRARGQAYKEAADHLLQQSWTDDRVEMEQAIFAAAQIQRLADACFGKGDAMHSNIEVY